MVMTDSKRIYEMACRQWQQLSQNQQYYLQNQNTNYNIDSRNDFETMYLDIIKTLFYELITNRHSELLSILCSYNDIQAEFTNFILSRTGYRSKSTYDLLPILHGLNSFFRGNIDDCISIYSQFKKDIFQGKEFALSFDYKKHITEQLIILDNQIGRLLSTAPQSREKMVNNNLGKLKETKSVATVIRIHDPKLTDKLNQFAENRRAKDSVLLEQIQQLQLLLQDELKEVMCIREGINYNTNQEAISQFISLFSLISETLHYHPNNENKDSYKNLVESCEDFLEYIKQSLTILGVTIINDLGKPYDPEKHKTTHDTQPIRHNTISKVVNIGFSYKNKVLEKAEVELS